MKKNEKPILFKGDMVRAALEGRKNQTRRIMKNQPCGQDITDVRIRSVDGGFQWFSTLGKSSVFKCPFGSVGDILYVRETCRAEELESGEDGVRYLADNEWRGIENTEEAARLWFDLRNYRNKLGATVPNIHMPRWASRINLEIVGVRVERLNDISEEDAAAEGCHLECMTPTGDDNGSFIYGSSGFANLWESINGAGSWDANPWVWAIEFNVINGAK